jgi:hypothetical protein
MLYSYLVLNIWYQSSSSWGFAATFETPWHFHYNFVSTTFQNKLLGGYLLDRSQYVGFKMKLIRHYTLGYKACTI